jgi:integral membrane sensor domain MASE1
VGYRQWFGRRIVRDQLQQYATFCSLAAGSTQKVFEDLRGKKEMFMHIALGTAFGMIAAAPFIGRWRANVWLKKNMPQEQIVSRIPEIA